MQQRSFVRYFKPGQPVPAALIDQRRGYLVLRHARLQGRAVIATYGMPSCPQ